MTALPNNVAQITEAHLEGLIAASVVEGVTLEFKAEPYAADHEGVREFLKDVTSFANTAGGTLLIGVKETDGSASDLNPLKPADIDRMKLRLESLLQDAVEPRVFGIRIHPVPVTGGQVLAIHVQRSMAVPHRITAKNSNRFYLRSSAGAYEASMEELRDLFTQTAGLAERVSTFRDRRLALLGENGGSIPLAEAEDRLTLHIVPFTAQRGIGAVNLSAVEDLSKQFRPMGASGWNPGYNLDGFANTRGGQHCHGYTQVFRDGTVEAVKCGFLGRYNENTYVQGYTVEELLRDYLPLYLEGLRALDVAPPFLVSVAIQGVRNAIVVFDTRGGMFETPLPLLVDDLLLPFSVISDFAAKDAYLPLLKPTLDALWNAGGRSEWVARATS